MAQAIKIKLDTGRYATPTADDIKDAKQYILNRESTAKDLKELADGLLEDAAERIVTICYKYNVSPGNFTISEEYNPEMMAEIEAVMDELEEAILELMDEHAAKATDNEQHKALIIAWIATLGRGNRNLKDTLETYMAKFLKDIEAAVAALRFMGASQSEAITKIKTYLHHIYDMPEVRTAIRNRNNILATFIRLGGVWQGAVGLSNNGSTNITRMLEITLQMAWMREQALDFQEKGAAGYYQLRGSTYNCDACDEAVGFHEGTEDIMQAPLVHPHCCCYRIPIYFNN